MTTLNPSAERLAESLFGDEQTTDFVAQNVTSESDLTPEADWRDIIVQRPQSMTL